MRNQDQLLLLVQSLTKSEKSYFIKSLQTSHDVKPKKYLLLFRKIDEIKGDSLDQLKENINDPEIKMYFNQYKKYLFDVLLDSLIRFWRSDSIAVKLCTLLAEAFLLEQKMLLRSANRIATKVLHLSQKSGNHSFGLVAYSIVQRVRAREKMQGTLADFENRINDWNEFIEIYNEYIKISALHYSVDLVVSAVNMNHLRNTENGHKMFNSAREQITNFLPADTNDQEHARIFRTYYKCWSSYLFDQETQLNIPQILNEQKELLKTLDDEFILLNNDLVIRYLYNCGYFSMKHNYLEYTQYYTEQLLNFSTQSENLKDLALYMALSLSATIGLKDEIFLPKTIETLSKNEHYLNKILNEPTGLQSSILYIISAVFYRAGQYKKALRYNNGICFGNMSGPSLSIYRSLVLNLLLMHQKKVDSYDYIVNHIEKLNRKYSWEREFLDKLINLLETELKDNAELIKQKALDFIEYIEKNMLPATGNSTIQTIENELKLISWASAL